MKIEDLKSQIEKKVVTDNLIIFVCSENTFVAEQYYRQIAKDKDKEISLVDELSDLTTILSNPFLDHTNDLFVYRTDKLEAFDNPDSYRNTIIVCNELVGDMDTRYVCRVPKIDKWCVYDLLYSNLTGVSEDNLKQLADLLDGDVFRTQQEIDRFNVFPEGERNHAVREALDSNFYNDLCKLTIFDLSNAVIHKNVDSIRSILYHIDSMDVEPLGLTKILYNSFKSIILIQLQGYRATPENTGLEAKQFYAIKKNNIGFYKHEKLVDIFCTLAKVYKQLVLGELPMDNIIDYLMINILL